MILLFMAILLSSCCTLDVLEEAKEVIEDIEEITINHDHHKKKEIQIHE